MAGRKLEDIARSLNDPEARAAWLEALRDPDQEDDIIIQPEDFPESAVDREVRRAKGEAKALERLRRLHRGG